jgi:hypothetical protein
MPCPAAIPVAICGTRNTPALSSNILAGRHPRSASDEAGGDLAAAGPLDVGGERDAQLEAEGGEPPFQPAYPRSLRRPRAVMTSRAITA